VNVLYHHNSDFTNLQSGDIQLLVVVHNSPLQVFHNHFVLLSRPTSARVHNRGIKLEVKHTQKVCFFYLGLFHIVICYIFYLRYNCSVIGGYCRI